MTYVLIAIIVALALLLARAVFVRLAEFERDRRYTSEPSNLSVIVESMLGTVEARNQWDDVERMRYELGRGFMQINKIRHDPSKKDLRASKPSRVTAK